MKIFDKLLISKIPKEVFAFNKKIMHITDTPDVTFSYIKRLIRIIKPDIIIHTGDLVDNIKLEFSRSKISIYETRVKTLLKILRSENAEKIVICLGNHDDEEIIRKYLLENEFLYNKICLDIEDKKYFITHKYETIKDEKADFYLFGHDIDEESQTLYGKYYLNGLFYIHVIDELTGSVSKIPYPKDTDYFRQKKFKIGL